MSKEMKHFIIYAFWLQVFANTFVLEEAWR